MNFIFIGVIIIIVIQIYCLFELYQIKYKIFQYQNKYSKRNKRFRDSLYNLQDNIFLQQERIDKLYKWNVE